MEGGGLLDCGGPWGGAAMEGGGRFDCGGPCGGSLWGASPQFPEAINSNSARFRISEVAASTFWTFGSSIIESGPVDIGGGPLSIEPRR